MSKRSKRIDQAGGVHADRDIIADIVAGRDVITEEKTYDVTGLPNPYRRGLQAYTYEDREAFAGREAAVQEALEKLTHPSGQQVLLFVTGASGSGKSSFVQAGLLPMLVEHYTRPSKEISFYVNHPSSDPIAVLSNALDLLELTKINKKALLEIKPQEFSRRLGDLTPANQVNLLVIDQFEELFTQSPPEQSDWIFSFLTHLPPFEEINTHVIAALRSDFLGELFKHRPLWEAAVQQGVALRAMSVEELKEAIQRPLQTWADQHDRYAQKRFEPALVECLAEDAAKDASFLPLLQVTLQELWDRGRLKLASYKGLDDAIRKRAEKVYEYEDHSTSSPQRHRSVVDREEILTIFLNLVNVSLDDDPRRDVRRSRLKRELVAGSPRRLALIDELAGAKARLLRTDQTPAPVDSFSETDQRLETVDIIHEALLRDWDRLTEAIANRRHVLQLVSRFEQALKDWQTADEEKKEDYLLIGVHFEEAKELFTNADFAPQGDAAREFLRRSQEKAEAALREAQKRNEQLSQALEQAQAERDRAEEQRRHALEQESLARSRELAAVSITQLAEDPERGLLIALEAVRSAPTFQAQDSLRRCLIAQTKWAVLGENPGAVIDSQFSPDGRQVLVYCADGTGRVWDTATGKMLSTFQGKAPYLNKLAWHLLTGTRIQRGQAQFSPDGKWIAVCCEDGTVRMVDVTSGEEFEALTHTSSLYSNDISTDGCWIANGSGDGTAHLWRVQGPRRHITLNGHSAGVLTARFSRDGSRVVTGSFDLTARVWDANTGETLSILGKHEEPVWSASFSPDGRWVLTICRNLKVNIWVAETGGRLATLIGRPALGSSNPFSPDGRMFVNILVRNDGKDAEIVNLEVGEIVAVLHGHEAEILFVHFSPDGQRILTASMDLTARWWDARDGKELANFQGHQSWITNARFSADGRWIVTSSEDRTARVWITPGGQEPTVISGHAGAVHGARFSPDGQLVVTAGADGTARVWEASSGNIRYILNKHTEAVYRAIFSPDGEWLFTASADGTARIWEVATGKELEVLKGYSGSEELSYLSPIFARDEVPVLDADFFPSNRRVVMGGWDGIIHLWNVLPKRKPFSLKGEAAAVILSRFSPDGRLIMVLTVLGHCLVLDASSGAIRAKFLPPYGPTNTACFSPDSRWILTGSQGGSCTVWEAESGKQLSSFSGLQGPISRVAFSSDAQAIAAAGWAGQIRVWKAAAGLPEADLYGHNRPVKSLQFSRDGKCLLSASEDGTARLWDTTSGKELANLPGHSAGVNSAEFSPDGRWVLTASQDGTARVSAVHLKDLLRLAKSRLTRELTTGERSVYLGE